MRFNANRLAPLAGIGSSSETLNEAGNRSHHEDRNSDDAELVWGKNQLNEQESETDEDAESDAGPSEGEGNIEEGDANTEEADLDEVIEIDEGMLRREIMRMRNERNDTVAEAKLRKVIRSEIGDIVSEISDTSLNSDSSWVYGDNKPSNSKKGQVTLSALGIGFK